MRLLERRHQEVTATATDGASRRVGGGFGAESIVPGASADVTLEEAPRLRVEIAAAPQTGVIPGAMVGIAVDVYNDGTAPAPGATLQLSLPMESEYREGSLRLEGREITAPERLFGTGISIPRLPGETSTKVTFQLRVLPGLTPLILQPRLRAEGVPIVGTVGISIKRGTIGPTAPAAQPPPRPFYELEEDELDEIGGGEEEQSILPPVLVEDEEAIAEAVAEPAVEPPREPEPEPEPAAALPELELDLRLEPEPAPAPEPEPSRPPATAAVPAVEARPARYRAIGAAELALLERLFATETPGPIAHLMTISTLACTQGPDGGDVGGFDSAVRKNADALARALVLQRLGKTPVGLVPAGQLEALAADAEPALGAAPPHPALRRTIRRTDANAIAALVRSTDRDPTMRFHLALLALGAEAVDGLGDAAHAGECAVMLVSYRANALAWLGPACVGSAGHPGTALPDPTPALDAAGRRLVAALRAALA